MMTKSLNHGRTFGLEGSDDDDVYGYLAKFFKSQSGYLFV